MKLGIIKNPSVLLRVLMGVVFCSAGLFRLFVPQAALDEMANLGLPVLLVFPITAFEIVLGLFLILNRYVKYTAGALVLFLAVALIKGMIAGGWGLFSLAGELFVFNVTPTDIFLHLVFLIILLYLFLTTVSKDSPNVPSDAQQN